MSITLQAGLNAQTLPGARSADTPVVRSTEPAPPSTLPGARQPEDANAEVNAFEQRRLDRITEAAQQFFNDNYAVSDTTFTIFKDKSGQYITRYTSLRDGRVTYFPEPQLLKRLEISQPQPAALVEIQA